MKKLKLHAVGVFWLSVALLSAYGDEINENDPLPQPTPTFWGFEMRTWLLATSCCVAVLLLWLLRRSFAAERRAEAAGTSTQD